MRDHAVGVDASADSLHTVNPHSGPTLNSDQYATGTANLLKVIAARAACNVQLHKPLRGGGEQKTLEFGEALIQLH